MWVSLSLPPLIKALASTTATAMPLLDLQLSTKTWFDVSEGSCFGFGGGWLFTMVLQHGPGGAVGSSQWSSIVTLERLPLRERERETLKPFH